MLDALIESEKVDSNGALPPAAGRCKASPLHLDAAADIPAAAIPTAAASTAAAALRPVLFWSALGLVLLALPPLLVCIFHLPLRLTRVHDVIFSLAIAGAGAITFMRQRSAGSKLTTVLFALTALFYLQLIDLASDQANAVDYMQVVIGAMSFVQHGTPYFPGTSYVLYPPFYAETFAAVFSLTANVARALGFHLDQTNIWQAVQYLFQNILFLSVVALGALCHRFCRQFGRLSNLRATFLTLALIIPSAAVFWTVRKYQSNIFVTDLMLLAMLLVDRSPALAALSLVAGANIKVYPGLLGIAWFFGKRFKSCAWTGFWLAVFIAGETLYCGRATIWSEYFHTANRYISTLPVETPKWLLGSPNLLNETGRILALIGVKDWSLERIAQTVHLEQMLIVLWFGWRFLTAPQAVRKQVDGFESSCVAALTIDQKVMIERSCDLISLMLIIGPSVLSDHYVMSIPVAIWTVLVAGRRHPWLVSTGVCCTLAWSLKSVVPIGVEPIGLLILALARRRS